MSDVAIMDLRGVTVWEQRKVILRDVTWRVCPGEHWAMIGANGSGKTTLLKVATGYRWPAAGAVTVLGEVFGQVDLRVLRRRIGWVSAAVRDMVRPQDRVHQIVLGGAFGSIGLYDDATTEQGRRADMLLAELRAAEHLVEARFGTLSLGEQQRVLVARALMPEPDLLILDEACAGLDLRAREELLEAIDRLTARPGGPALVFVTHHVEEISPAFTHALVLAEGRVLAAGPKDEVLTGKTLSAAFGVVVEVERHDGRFWPRVVGCPAPTGKGT